MKATLRHLEVLWRTVFIGTPKGMENALGFNFPDLLEYFYSTFDNLAIWVRFTLCVQVTARPLASQQERAGTSGSSGAGGSWGITSIFSNNDTRALNGSSKEIVLNRGYSEPAQTALEPSFSSIQLREV